MSGLDKCVVVPMFFREHCDLVLRLWLKGVQDVNQVESDRVGVVLVFDPPPCFRHELHILTSPPPDDIPTHLVRIILPAETHERV